MNNVKSRRILVEMDLVSRREAKQFHLYWAYNVHQTETCLIDQAAMNLHPFSVV